MEEEKKKSNVGLIVFLILIILGLAGYICYDKFLAKDGTTIQDKNDAIKKDDSESQNVNGTNDNIECQSYEKKDLTYMEFNDSYYKSNVCTRYVIKDLGIELVDKKIVKYDDDEYFHSFLISINEKDIRDFQELTGGRLELNVFNNYVVLGFEDMSGATTVYVYNKTGDLVYKLPNIDSNGCLTFASISEDYVLISQKYSIDDTNGAANTCSIKYFPDNVSDYCPSDSKLLIIYKNLQEVDGKLELVQDEHHECYQKEW